MIFILIQKMCCFCLPPLPNFIPIECPPMTFSVSFILWWLFAAGVVFFFSFYIVVVQNCTELKPRVSRGCSRELPRLLPVPPVGTVLSHSQSTRLLPAWGWLRSKSPHGRIVLALPYTVSELYHSLFLHAQGNVWKRATAFLSMS